MSASWRDVLRLARGEGWSVARTKGGHLRLSHPEAERVVITPSTPGCRRTLQNTAAEMKRALPRRSHSVGPSPAPEDRPKAKKKPPVRPRPPVVADRYFGRARELGTRRLVGHVGDFQIELVLDEGEAGRSWKIFLTGSRP